MKRRITFVSVLLRQRTTSQTWLIIRKLFIAKLLVEGQRIITRHCEIVSTYLHLWTSNNSYIDSGDDTSVLVYTEKA